MHLDLELAGGEDALHPLLAEDESVAEGAGAAEAGVAGAEVNAALAAAQAGVDRDRDGRVGAVADLQVDAALAGLGGHLGGGVFDDALFRFGFLLFFGGDFGAELDVFLVFDRAVVGRDFFVFVSARFVAAFGLFGFVVGRGQRRYGEWQARGLRRTGDRAENKQGEEDKQFSHRPTIGVSAILL